MTMPTLNDDLQEYREIAEQSFAQWMPRICTDEWLRTVSGPSRFVWDREALQIGFHDPLYHCYDARPERWRPILTAALLTAAGHNPADHAQTLAALESLYLSTLMLQGFRNGRTLADALPSPEADPLSIMATAAYTAAQLAPTLVSLHADAVLPARRSWLACRFGQALVQRAAGSAEMLMLWNREQRLLDDRAYVSYVQQFSTPLSFVLPVDCLIAAAKLDDARLADLLRRAAMHLGIAYQLTVEWKDHDRVQHSPDPHPVPREVSGYFAGPDSMGLGAEMTRAVEMDVRFAPLAEEQWALAYDTIQALPPTFSAIFTTFETALRATLVKGPQTHA